MVPSLSCRHRRKIDISMPNWKRTPPSILLLSSATHRHLHTIIFGAASLPFFPRRSVSRDGFLHTLLGGRVPVIIMHLGMSRGAVHAQRSRCWLADGRASHEGSSEVSRLDGPINLSVEKSRYEAPTSMLGYVTCHGYHGHPLYMVVFMVHNRCPS